MSTPIDTRNIRATVRSLNHILATEYPSLSFYEKTKLFLLPVKNCPRDYYKTVENALILDPNDEYTKKMVAIQRHYIKFSAASFGSFVKINKKYEAGCSYGPYQYRLSNSKFGSKSMKNACTILDLEADNIHFVNKKSKQLLPVCFYVVDDAKKEVDIVIRGTLSMHDLSTDLDFTPVPFKGGFTHGGILKATNNLLALMEKAQFLETIPNNYKIVLTGHSLGGGVATVMGFILREKYGDRVRTLAFSPVPTVSRELIEDSKQFTTTMVLGYDPVCSYSEKSIFDYVEKRYNLPHSETPRMYLYPGGKIYHFINHTVPPENSSAIKSLKYRRDWVLKVQDNTFFDSFTPSGAELYIYHNVGIQYKILDEFVKE